MLPGVAAQSVLEIGPEIGSLTGTETVTGTEDGSGTEGTAADTAEAGLMTGRRMRMTQDMHTESTIPPGQTGTGRIPLTMTTVRSTSAHTMRPCILGAAG